MATTKYAIEILYNDSGVRRSTGSMDRLGRSADRTGRKVDYVGRAIRRVGVYIGAGLLFRAGKSAFLDFNSTMEQARVQMAGLMQLNLGGDWSKHMKTANQLVKQFQQDAKLSVGTTKDFVEMASNITQPVLAAGMGMKELREITRGAVVAGRAFGQHANIVALDIEQALMGNLTKRDRFARKLLKPMGFDTSNFNALDAKQRAETLLKAFNQPAIRRMAAEQKTTFAGVTSTLKDNLQIMLGKVGLPMFKAITAEVKQWNDWISKNPQKIKEFAQDFAQTLVSGFKMFKSIAGFIIEHRQLFMTIAKAMLITKGVRFLTGGLVGMAEFGHGLKIGGAGLARFTGKLGNAIGALGRFAPALAGLYVGAQYLFDKAAQSQERDIAKRGEDRPQLLKQQLEGLVSGRFSTNQRLIAKRAGFNTFEDQKAFFRESMIRQARESGILVRGQVSNQAIATKLFGDQFTDEAIRRARSGEGKFVGGKIGQAAQMAEALQRMATEEHFKEMGVGIIGQLKLVRSTLEFNGTRQDQRLAQWVEISYAQLQAAYKLDFALGENGPLHMLNKGLQSYFKFFKIAGHAAKPVRVTLKQEIRTDDPDRVAIAAAGMIKRVLQNPTMARRAQRPG